ncbi:transporter substrate-binding domain-containing protein [Eubacteriaceae bacterium ES2]|nr:transporter substrate-binding domain-containing protein [Eubacteriaceae bacterium ES2]
MVHQKYLKVGFIFLLISLTLLAIGCEKQQIPTETSETGANETTADPSQSQQLLLVTGEYQPYTSEALEGYGFFTQIVEAVLTDAGIDYRIEFYPWERGLEMVQNGQAFATFPYDESKNRNESYYTIDGIVTYRQCFYYLSSNEKLAQEGADFNSISDFAGYTFGGANGYWYGSKEDVEALGLTVEWANDTEALLKMLDAGRIDFMMEDERVADTLISQLFPDDVEAFAKLPNAASSEDYHLLASKSYPNSVVLCEKFDASLAKLKENGEIDRILAENGINK